MPPIQIGNGNVGNIQVGGQNVANVFQGSNLIWTRDQVTNPTASDVVMTVDQIRTITPGSNRNASNVPLRFLIYPQHLPTLRGVNIENPSNADLNGKTIQLQSINGWQTPENFFNRGQTERVTFGIPDTDVHYPRVMGVIVRAGNLNSIVTQFYRGFAQHIGPDGFADIVLEPEVDGRFASVVDYGSEVTAFATPGILSTNNEITYPEGRSSDIGIAVEWTTPHGRYRHAINTTIPEGMNKVDIGWDIWQEGTIAPDTPSPFNAVITPRFSTV